MSANLAAPPLNASSSPGQGAPLFKAVPGESFQASPFNPAPATASVAPLTVGDLLPQLPPDVARVTGLPSDHPVALPQEVLENALSSGKPEVPIFEVWRVCPAMFQTTISPQDPRLVPLPAAKLPRLIVITQPGQGAQPFSEPASAPAPAFTPAASPFAAASASPFTAQAAAPAPAVFGQENAPFASPAGIALPPRRNGPPPPLADASVPGPVALSLPGKTGAPTPAPGGQPFPVSPFSAARPGGEEPASPPAQAPSFMPQTSPFQAAARLPQQDPAVPVSLKPPGDMGGLVAPAGEKSLPAMPPGPSPAPGAPAGDSPFTALFGPKVTTTGQPAPDPPRPAPALHSSNGGGQVRLSVAGLLRGYSVAELGFDPLIVPAWIMTSQPAHDVRQWLELPSPQTNLGVLVDNITDVGFRNVLNNAHREFQVLLAREELMRALQGESPPTLPSLASLKPAAPVFPAQPPSGNGGASPFQVSLAQPPSSIGGTSTFQASPAQPPSSNGGASPFQVSPAPLSAPQPAPREIKAQVFQVMPSAGAPAVQEPAAPPPSPVFGAPPAQTPFSAPPPASPPAQPSPFIVQPAPPPGAPAFAQQAPASAFAAGTAEQNHAPGLITPDPARQPAAPAPVPPQVFPVSPDFTPERTGFGSAELMAAPSAPESRPPMPVPPPQQFTPPVERPPQQIAPVFPAIEPAPPPAAQAFIPPASSAPAFTPAASPPRPAPQAAPPALGIQAADSRPDQIMLRALLGTDEELTAQRVVEMTCALPGIAACVCLRGEQALSHIGAHKPQAREFQKQATGLSHHLRSLAPLIGIEGAETFTLTSGDRLMTFCFPENIIFGILHDAAPSLGLRDKITLIARELSRMLP